MMHRVQLASRAKGRSHTSRAALAVMILVMASGLHACKREQVRAEAVATPPPETAGQPSTEPDRGSSEGQTGEARARELLAQWKRAHPERAWVETEREKHHIVPPADNSDVIGNPQGHTYGRITEQTVEMWERETLKLATEGSRIFHSADELGSTIGVSCDMCHPDGANTHPETYPKFQVQMGRVAHLRDMINWCIEQATQGDRLEADSMKMRALEAYIYAQRKGTPLQYGRR